MPGRAASARLADLIGTAFGFPDVGSFRQGILPALREARVLRHKVGLRPVRPSVRVERVGRLVHCYGHGGAGVTMSWGTADEVAGMLGSAHA